MPQDYGPKAATYLKVLGWINLLWLNLGGLLWLWFASELQERNNKFRRAAIVILGLHTLAAAFVLLLLLVNPQYAPKVSVFGEAVHSGPTAFALAAGFAIIHLIPMTLLLAPGTRSAFERRVERGLCVYCGYDLRASAKRCPECGTPIPPPIQEPGASGST